MPRIGFFVLIVLSCFQGFALTFKNDTSKVVKSKPIPLKHLNEPSTSIGSVRSFNELDGFPLVDEALDPFENGLHEDSTITGKIAEFRSRADVLFDEVRNAQKYVDYLDETTLLQLPVGINKTIGNIDYTILIDSMVLTPTHAYLTSYMVFDIPSSGKRIAFRGAGIKFSKNGGIDPEAKLILLGDYEIPVNNKSMLLLKGDSETFVQFDCNGFQSMGVSGEIVFSRDVIIPDTSSGQTNERVKSSFSTTLTNWNDFLVEVTIPKFQIRALNGMSFSVDGAVFDFSDFRNGSSVQYPSNYLSESGLDQNPTFWRGIYLRSAIVTLPPQFNKKNGDQASFITQNLLIDNNGLTGSLSAENLLQLSEGDMNGWGFSIESLKAEFRENQLVSGGFEGMIVLPISEDNKTFEYSALIYPGSEYVFSVSTPEDINFEVFKASQVQLFENSSLEVMVVDNKFLPKANLYGTMNIDAPMGKKGASLADIQFENLQIQTVTPFIQADYFSLGSEIADQAMAGFPVQIQDISLKNLSDTETALDFDLVVNVSESFSGETNLSIIGKTGTDEHSNWQFDRAEVEAIYLDVQTAAFDFKGSLNFYRNDEVYGDGFNGQIDARFNSIGVNIGATAIFGNADGYRYWYVDGAASLRNGIPVSPGLNLTGIAGGAYHHMTIDGAGEGNELGQTNTGLVYIPDQNAGLGFKAAVTFSTVGGNAFTGNAALEMAFNSGGGIRYINFKGSGYFMTAPSGSDLSSLSSNAKELGTASSKTPDGLLCKNNSQDSKLTSIFGSHGNGGEGVSAHVFIEFDFENRTLHGNFEVYMKVAGGVIKGVGNNNRAGWAVLHFGPDDWYIYIGTPNDRIGVSVGIGSIRATATGYFMVGTSIPGSPPPPDIVSDILGGMDLGYMDDLNELGNGAGFGFGASLDIDTGDLSFLMFYARFQAGAGFDVMLKDYGNTTCEGENSPIGINGWYANGQAYAYFDGKIGIKIKIFGRRKKVNILSVGAAAVLQAKLPNPFWMRGVVGGQFSVLGGLVKGNCKFQVTIGKECQLEQNGSVLEGINVIADMTPSNNESDVNVFTTPQAIFNLQIEKNFEMIDVNDERKVFRIKLDHFKVLANGQEIVGDFEWNTQKDVLILNPFDILPPKRDLKAQVQVSFEEHTNGTWSSVIVDGKKYVESMEVSFKTGEAPDFIPHSNIAYCYPTINMLNFYPEEAPNGYIRLKQGQPYLFDTGDEWEQKGRISSSGQELSFDINYSSSNKEVTYALPDGISKNQIFKFELVNIPVESSQSIDRNVSLKNEQVGETETTISSKKGEGSIAELQEKSIFENFLRSSSYGTFAKKIQSQTITRTSREIAFLWEGLYSSSTIQLNEGYATEELDGSIYTAARPTIRLEADLANNSYFNNAINPLIYEGYPYAGTIAHRNVDSLGVIPIRAVRISQNNPGELTESNILSGSYFFTDSEIRIQYLLSPIMYYDFRELQAKAANKYVNNENIPERIQRLIWGQFPIQSPGTYNIRAYYFLPGQDNANSEVLIPTVLTLD